MRRKEASEREDVRREKKERNDGERENYRKTKAKIRGELEREIADEMGARGRERKKMQEREKSRLRKRWKRGR